MLEAQDVTKHRKIILFMLLLQMAAKMFSNNNLLYNSSEGHARISLT
jgi:hypothetical protein